MEAPSPQRRDAWFSACAAGELGHVRRLLSAMAGQRNGLGQTGLMLAAQHGHLAVVRTLLESERGITDDHGQTALMYAAAEDRLECVLELAPWEAGYMDVYGKYAVDYARVPAVRFVLRQERWDNEAVAAFMRFVRRTSYALNAARRGRPVDATAEVEAERFRGTQFYAAARRLAQAAGRVRRPPAPQGRREPGRAAQRPAVA